MKVLREGVASRDDEACTALIEVMIADMLLKVMYTNKKIQ